MVIFSSGKVKNCIKIYSNQQEILTQQINKLIRLILFIIILLNDS